MHPSASTNTHHSAQSLNVNQTERLSKRSADGDGTSDEEGTRLRSKKRRVKSADAEANGVIFKRLFALLGESLAVAKIGSGETVRWSEDLTEALAGLQTELECELGDNAEEILSPELKEVRQKVISLSAACKTLHQQLTLVGNWEEMAKRVLKDM
ncbi:hypothetical protein CC2G_006475 [Coprinopsis cinerea AmutBmut pab1-1]|nr:hypothetical protein CC2G_003810 [Coprinopsis cinerea AmutBmut pab1-1]KAG2021220.1 hypothetical protein CC2G_006475 [Coprinopsis cinerea AmutBmut pab1-1]